MDHMQYKPLLFAALMTASCSQPIREGLEIPELLSEFAEDSKPIIFKNDSNWFSVTYGGDNEIRVYADNNETISFQAYNKGLEFGKHENDLFSPRAGPTEFGERISPGHRNLYNSTLSNALSFRRKWFGLYHKMGFREL